jgi:hypothetical protein
MSRYVVRVTLQAGDPTPRYRKRHGLTEKIELATYYAHPSGAREGAERTLCRIPRGLKPKLEIIDTRDGKVLPA